MKRFHNYYCLFPFVWETDTFKVVSVYCVYTVHITVILCYCGFVKVYFVEDMFMYLKANHFT